MRILVSSNPNNLRQALKATGEATATVEAEYGEEVVEGSYMTLAHHGSRSHNIPPCLYSWSVVSPHPADLIVGVSHIDLDTLGGLMYLGHSWPKEETSNWENFWRVVAYVDIHGPHNLSEALDDIRGFRLRECRSQADKVERDLNAFWAWSENNRIYPPRDGSVKDITDEVQEAVRIICKIFGGNPELLQEGMIWKEAKDKLDKDSFIESIGDVILRNSSQFTNHLYRHSKKAVVAYNPERGSITVSLPEPLEDISCKQFVQDLWGLGAGGRDVIAGSPRDREMSFDDARQAANRLAMLIDDVVNV